MKRMPFSKRGFLTKRGPIMSARCVGDGPVVLEYSYDSVAVTRKRAKEIVSVLCLGERVKIINLTNQGDIVYAQVRCKILHRNDYYTIEMGRWVLSTLLHEITHVNVRVLYGHHHWGYHDRRFKREQKRLYETYNRLAEIIGWHH